MIDTHAKQALSSGNLYTIKLRHDDGEEYDIADVATHQLLLNHNDIVMVLRCTNSAEDGVGVYDAVLLLPSGDIGQFLLYSREFALLVTAQ